MLKIRLHRDNTDIFVAVGMAAAILLIAVLNVAVILPGLFRVFTPVADTAGRSPVDSDAVTRALDAVRE